MYATGCKQRSDESKFWRNRLIILYHHNNQHQTFLKQINERGQRCVFFLEQTSDTHEDERQELETKKERLNCIRKKVIIITGKSLTKS